MKYLKLKNNFIAFFIIIGIFYGPRIATIDYSLLISFFVAIYYIFSSLYGKNIYKESLRLQWFEYFFIYILLYAFVLYGISGFSDYLNNGQYFFRLLRSCAVYISFIFIIKKLEISLRVFVVYVFIAVGINSLVLLFQYFATGEIKLFFLNLNTLLPLKTNALAYVDIFSGTRVRGLMKGFDGAAILSSSFAILALFFLKKRVLKWVLITLAFVLSVISARLGFVIVFLAFFFKFIHSIFNRQKVFEIIFLGAFPVFLLIFVSFLFPKISFVQKSLYRTLEPFYNYYVLDSFSTRSTDDVMQNHLTIKRIPYDKKILILGKASRQMRENKPNVLSSDVGFIHLLFNFGIFNLFAIILVHFLCFCSIQSQNKFYGLSILTIFLVISIKGPYFFTRGIYDLVIISFIFLKTEQALSNEKLDDNW